MFDASQDLRKYPNDDDHAVMASAGAMPHNSRPFVFWSTGWGPSGRRFTHMAYTLFGIKACDTMKKARGWLDEHGIAYSFHDYKAQGIDRAHLQRWCEAHGWETVLNRAGTTFRKLPDADKAGLDQARAIDLMLAQPSMIKRPVLDLGERTLVGFKPDHYAAALS